MKSAAAAALAMMAIATCAHADDDGLARCVDGQASAENNQEIAIACDYALRNAPMDRATRALVHFKLALADQMHVVSTKKRYIDAKYSGDQSAADSARTIMDSSYERAAQNFAYAAELDSALAPQATYISAQAAAIAMNYAQAAKGMTTLIDRGQDVWTGRETLRLHHLYQERGRFRCREGLADAALADIKKGIEIGGQETARYWQDTLARFKTYYGPIDGTYSAALEAAIKKVIQAKDLFACSP